MTRSIQRLALQVAWFAIAALTVAPAHAVTYTWKGVPNSLFDSTAAWTPSGVPSAGDTVTFNTPSTYNMLVETSPSISELNVLTGNVSFGTWINPFTGSFGPQTVTVNDTVSANGNSSLTVGGVDLPLNIQASSLYVQNGSTLKVLAGSQFSTNAFATGLNGDAIIDGGQFDFNGGYVGDYGEDGIGTGGGRGSLTLQNGAVANFAAEVSEPYVIYLAADPSSSKGSISATGGSIFNTNFDIELSDQNMNSTASIDIEGAHSALIQTDVFISTITEGPNTFPVGVVIGSDANGSATINIGQSASGGALNTGSLGLKINKTGAVNVGSSTTTGTLYANGNVVINGGTLFVGQGSQFYLANGKTLTLNGGEADFLSTDLNGHGVSFVAGSLSFAGNLLVGTGGLLGTDLTLASDRQLTLNGASTVTIDPSHTLTVSGGELHVGTIVNNGTLFADTGTLDTGFATLGSGSTLQINLRGTARKSQYGVLSASSTVFLNGKLVVSIPSTDPQFIPVAGNSFDILDWGSHSGAFSSFQFPPLSTGLTWNISQLYVTGVISVVPLGDYDANLIVDAADYIIWRKGLGTTYTQNDYNVWKANFGNHSGPGAGGSATIAPAPEPASLFLLVWGGLGLLGLFASRIGKGTDARQTIAGKVQL